MTSAQVFKRVCKLMDPQPGVSCRRVEPRPGRDVFRIWVNTGGAPMEVVADWIATVIPSHVRFYLYEPARSSEDKRGRE